MINYKELAENVYEDIFIQNTHFLKSDISQIVKEVIEHRALLDKSSGKLFIDELIKLFQKDKFAIAQRQKQQMGKVLIQKYDEILELFGAISELNLVNNILDFGWQGEEGQLSKLFDRMVGKFLCRKTNKIDFVNAFLSPSKLEKPIKWIATNRAIVVFLEALLANKMISNTRYPSVIEKTNLFINKNDKKLTSADLTSAKNASLEKELKEDEVLLQDIVQSVNIESY